jgi:hypothetical protein
MSGWLWSKSPMNVEPDLHVERITEILGSVGFTCLENLKYIKSPPAVGTKQSTVSINYVHLKHFAVKY